MENQKAPTRDLAIFGIVVILFGYFGEEPYQASLRYIIEDSPNPTQDRGDLFAPWLLLAVLRVIDLSITAGIAKRLLVGKTTRAISGWLMGFVVIGLATIPWFLSGAKPEMEFLSLKESFFLRQLVLIGVAARLLYNRYKPEKE